MKTKLLGKIALFASVSCIRSTSTRCNQNVKQKITDEKGKPSLIVLMKIYLQILCSSIHRTVRIKTNSILLKLNLKQIRRISRQIPIVSPRLKS
jgi:hypothetical protein